MKIRILTENFAGPGFLAEHGLSYLVEHENFKILFDAGYSDVFIKNANKMKISIDDATVLVLSHGHWDHGNGLKFLSGKNLITHPNSFIKRYRRSNNEYLGLNMTFEEASKRFNISASRMPFWISNEIVFLGEIERYLPFEKWQTPYVDENGNDDFIVDDSAMAVIENNELNIITGCSHSGICNIIEYAKKVSGINKINSVIGGFHLKNNDSRTKKTIEYFHQQKIKNIFPGHCTQLPALSEFYKNFKIKQLKTGISINV